MAPRTGHSIPISGSSQRIADSACCGRGRGSHEGQDESARNRGRRGLDMLKRMQNNPKIELQMHEGNLPELRELNKVDERLVGLATRHDVVATSRVITLQRIQGIKIAEPAAC